MTEITIQQAAAFFAAFAIIAVAFAVGEIVRRKAARRKLKKLIHDEWERHQKATRGRK